MTDGPDFVAQHRLWSDEQDAAALRVSQTIDELGLRLIRVSFPDQHGILRGKTLTRDSFEQALREGHRMASTLLLKDTSHRTIYPVFSERGGLGRPELSGVADIVAVPDPTTFRTLPWTPDTGWVLCDLYHPDGAPVPLASRRVLAATLDRLAERGMAYRTGLEVEFHVFRITDARREPADAGQPGEPVEVEHLGRGYQLNTESWLDDMDEVVHLVADTAAGLGLPLRSIENEFGPSQLEATFEPGTGLTTADTMVLFRSAVKQVCRRRGYHATFMCRPRVPEAAASGWHLHQSLVDLSTGRNAFAPDPAEDAPLSQVGMHFLGGLLRHAAAATVFAAPTINSYKRYRRFSLAPDRILWGVDNRGALLRVISSGQASRIENRSGDPTANPYLYLASQLAAGLDGLNTQADPGPPSADPYDAAAQPLPASLMDALAALRADPLFADAFGRLIVDYVADLKSAEVNRFLAEVTDWEQREYFELF
jgi:glutamine synthetase